MKLCSSNLEKISGTGAVRVPQYDRSKVKPGIVHIGVGNFHQAHQCVFVEDALELPGQESWAYSGVGLSRFDVRMRDVLKEQDMMFTLWQRGTDTEQVRVIGCYRDFYLATEDSEEILGLLSSAQTKIVTLTITEKGYFVNFATGKLDTASPLVTSDVEALKAGKANLKTAVGFLVAAAAQRRSGAGAFAILSCDNLAENGNKTRMAVLEMAGAVDKELATWISENVSFPNSMVDRITPATTEKDKAELKSRYGLDDACPVVCEQFLLWVVEDKFPMGRPAWDKSTSGKCLFVEDSLPYELMKLRLLKGVHQALAYPAVLLGHALVHEAVADARISGFLRVYMAAAGRTVPPVQGLGKAEWCRTVLERFRNPAVRDTIFRLTEDARNRMAVSLAPCLEEDAIQVGPPLSRLEVEALVLPVSCWVLQLVRPDAKIPELNRDDNSGVVRDPALAAWAADEGSAEEAAAALLDTAFGAKAARSEVAKVLADQLQILKDKGIEALLQAVLNRAECGNTLLTNTVVVHDKVDGLVVTLGRHDFAQVRSGVVMVSRRHSHARFEIADLQDCPRLPANVCPLSPILKLLPHDSRFEEAPVLLIIPVCAGSPAVWRSSSDGGWESLPNAEFYPGYACLRLDHFCELFIGTDGACSPKPRGMLVRGFMDTTTRRGKCAVLHANCPSCAQQLVPTSDCRVDPEVLRGFVECEPAFFAGSYSHGDKLRIAQAQHDHQELDLNFHRFPLVTSRFFQAQQGHFEVDIADSVHAFRLCEANRMSPTPPPPPPPPTQAEGYGITMPPPPPPSLQEQEDGNASGLHLILSGDSDVEVYTADVPHTFLSTGELETGRLPITELLQRAHAESGEDAALLLQLIPPPPPPPDDEHQPDLPSQPPPPPPAAPQLSQRKNLMISGRFNDQQKMNYMRQVYEVLRDRSVPVDMVKANFAGATFGDQTARFLYRAKALLAFCTWDYGEKTGAQYETYIELQYAHQNHLTILAIQLCHEFPPCPKEEEGRALNALAFRTDRVRIIDKDMSDPKRARLSGERGPDGSWHTWADANGRTAKTEILRARGPSVRRENALQLGGVRIGTLKSICRRAQMLQSQASPKEDKAPSYYCNEKERPTASTVAVEDASTQHFPPFLPLSISTLLRKGQATEEIDEETRNLQLLEEGLSPKPWKGAVEELQASFLDPTFEIHCEEKLSREDVDSERTEGTRAENPDSCASDQGDSETVSSAQDVEEEDFSGSECTDSESEDLADLLEIAPAVGTRVEVYFTDGSWVPAIVTHARGMQARVSWDTCENTEELQDQCFLDFREDVVRLVQAPQPSELASAGEEG
ncbi:unnamed protein product [Symbiodinium sp. CCMP2456]|nr:unnamed protein product [Symbiodinium sp. CCMP2456]